MAVASFDRHYCRNPAEGRGIDLYGVEEIYQGSKRDIGRFGFIVGSLIDAAIELAGRINHYKRQEIEARLSELENSDTAESRKTDGANVATCAYLLLEPIMGQLWE